MKIGGFIISVMLVALFVGIFSLYNSNLAVNYGQDFDESEYDIYNQSVALNEQMVSINQSLSEINPSEGTVTSFVTAFLGSGWTVLKTTFQSFDIFNTMAEATFDKLNIGAGSNMFKIYMMMIGALIFFLLITGVVVGKDLI